MNNETGILKNEGAQSAEKLNQRMSVLPLVDIYENRDELLVLVDLPGVDKKGLAIQYEKGELTIEGGVKLDDGDGGAATEFDYRRSFAIPQGIDAEHISADLQSGVLKIHLPKSAALKPRQIRIQGE